MNECKQCGKELIHVEGRRKKQFCGETCRSAFWYNLNKKSKKEVKVTDLTKPTNEVKPPEQPATNYTIKQPYMSDAIKKKLGIK